MAQHDIRIVNDARRWNRQKTFLMSGIGVVVGFSNFWTFPSLMTQYGGMTFLLSYLVALGLFAVPFMALQVGLGKHIRKTPVLALQQLGDRVDGLSIWRLSGLLLVLAATLTVVIYSVVAGMGLAYAFKSAIGDFQGADVAKVASIFASLQQDADQMLRWLTVFVLVVWVISIRGMYRGLAVAVQYFIPLMAVILLFLALFSARLPTMESAAQVLFAHEMTSISWQGVLAAFKQAFFSLALGTGVFILLGAYMPSHGHITRVALTIGLVDTAVGVLAGLIVVPWLLMLELPLDQGFSLLFQSIPLALGNMSFGQFFGAMLFVLLTLAAWSSAIFLIEPLIAWLQERLSWGRATATTLVHIVVWLIGAGLVISLTDPQGLGAAGMPLFSLVQFMVSTLIIPLAGGLLLVLCVFVLPARKLAESLDMVVTVGDKTRPKLMFRIGHFLLRYICVPVVAVIQISMMSDLWVYSCQFNEEPGLLLCPGDEPVVVESEEIDIGSPAEKVETELVDVENENVSFPVSEEPVAESTGKGAGAIGAGEARPGGGRRKLEGVDKISTGALVENIPVEEEMVMNRETQAETTAVEPEVEEKQETEVAPD